MIEKDVKTIFNGNVAIPEKYIKQAKREGKGLRFKKARITEQRTVVYDIMEIRKDDIESRIAYKDGPHKDKFGGKDYMIVYFKWVPYDPQQAVNQTLL